MRNLLVSTMEVRGTVTPGGVRLAHVLMVEDGGTMPAGGRGMGHACSRVRV